MLPHAQDTGTTQSTVLKFCYIKDVFDSDSGSNFDSSPDSHKGSDLGLGCLYFAFEELVFEVVVVVVEPEEAVDIVVDTKTFVEIGLLPHKDKGDMA